MFASRLIKFVVPAKAGIQCRVPTPLELFDVIYQILQMGLCRVDLARRRRAATMINKNQAQVSAKILRKSTRMGDRVANDDCRSAGALNAITKREFPGGNGSRIGHDLRANRGSRGDWAAPWHRSAGFMCWPRTSTAWWWWTCTPRTNASSMKSSRRRPTAAACLRSRC